MAFFDVSGEDREAAYSGNRVWDTQAEACVEGFIAFNWHPIYQVLDIARSLLMTHASYNPMFWLYTALWGVCTFVGGFIFFWVAEERYGRE